MMFGDVRDEFLYGPPVPILMPPSFKALSIHRDLCKICYAEMIDVIFLPCKHKLFCMDCKDLLKQAICPLCGAEVRRAVREYSLVPQRMQ